MAVTCLITAVFSALTSLHLHDLSKIAFYYLLFNSVSCWPALFLADIQDGSKTAPFSL